MVRVLFDSSFLMAVAEKPTMWLDDIQQLLGSVQPTLISSTAKELSRMAAGQGRRSKSAALALELAKDFVVQPSGTGKVDDELVSSALSFHAAVATLDGELVKTLKARKVTVVGLRRGRVSLL